MSSSRLDRINHLLQREVAEMMYRIMNDAGVDLALYTVTGVTTTSDLRTAHVRVSIRAPAEQQPALLHRLSRHRGEFQSAIARHIKIKYTPHVVFELDESIARGDEVLRLIHEIEEQHPDWTPPAPAPEAPAEDAAPPGDGEETPK
jgi:ribosome-binding factor A